jgi:hypothetical protein
MNRDEHRTDILKALRVVPPGRPATCGLLLSDGVRRAVAEACRCLGTTTGQAVTAEALDYLDRERKPVPHPAPKWLRRQGRPRGTARPLTNVDRKR